MTRSEAHRQRDAPHKRQCPLLQGLIEPSCQQFTSTSQRNQHISTQIDCSDCSASVPGTQLDNQPCDAIESQVDTNGADSRTTFSPFFRLCSILWMHRSMTLAAPCITCDHAWLPFPKPSWAITSAFGLKPWQRLSISIFSSRRSSHAEVCLEGNSQFWIYYISWVQFW